MTKKFHIYETVSTVYGHGYIAGIRENDYVVKLVNWALAQGQSPTLYLQEEAIRAIPGALPGCTVETTFGTCRVESIRGTDGVHIVRPVNWKLANEKPATCYLQSDMLKFGLKAGFLEGDEVMTVYGQGFVDKVREHDIVVKLRHWKLAQGQSPTLYLHPSAAVKIPGVTIGNCLKTVWGVVRVLSIRRDGQHLCEAVHWTLADGRPPRFYLAPESFAQLSLKPV